MAIGLAGLVIMTGGPFWAWALESHLKRRYGKQKPREPGAFDELHAIRALQDLEDLKKMSAGEEEPEVNDEENHRDEQLLE